jgi:hypothetical protein
MYRHRKNFAWTEEFVLNDTLKDFMEVSAPSWSFLVGYFAVKHWDNSRRLHCTQIDTRLNTVNSNPLALTVEQSPSPQSMDFLYSEKLSNNVTNLGRLLTHCLLVFNSWLLSPSMPSQGANSGQSTHSPRTFVPGCIHTKRRVSDHAAILNNRGGAGSKWKVEKQKTSAVF